jgi:Siderophore-interacting FAD-binding domain
MAVPRPPLGGDGSVPRRDAGPICRSTTRPPGARYTITRSTERDVSDAEFGSHARHTSAIDDSCHGVVAARRWQPHSGGRQRYVVLAAGLVLDPPIDTCLASFEVISVTQLSTRRFLISLAGESPWEFDYSAGQDLLLVVAKNGTRADYGRYLIKRSDPRTRHLHIEVVLEPDGPAARWAASVVPGEPVAGIGPGQDRNGMGLHSGFTRLTVGSTRSKYNWTHQAGTAFSS